MHNTLSRRHTRLALLCVASLVIACVALGLVLNRAYQASAYPGATEVSDAALTRYTPTFALRRTTLYRTNDPFNQVYTWYSTAFDLGPESYAQSNCILMTKSVTTAWVFNEQMSVMVCNTPNDRMMFVMRSLILRY